MIGHVYRRTNGGAVVHFMREGAQVSSVPAPDLDSMHTYLWEAGYARSARPHKSAEDALETWQQARYDQCRRCALDANRRRTHCNRTRCPRRCTVIVACRMLTTHGMRVVYFDCGRPAVLVRGASAYCATHAHPAKRNAP